MGRRGRSALARAEAGKEQGACPIGWSSIRLVREGGREVTVWTQMNKKTLAQSIQRT